MSYTEKPDTQMENLLDAITEALLHDDYDFERIMDDYDVPQQSAHTLADLIKSLRAVLQPHYPSEEFVNNLRKELIGHKDGLLERVRYLPARVQIAAGLALVAGFVLISRRRILGEDESEDAAEMAEVGV